MYPKSIRVGRGGETVLSRNASRNQLSKMPHTLNRILPTPGSPFTDPATGLSMTLPIAYLYQLVDVGVKLRGNF